MAPAQMALPVDQQNGSSAAPRRPVARAVSTARQARAEAVMTPAPTPAPAPAVEAAAPVVEVPAPVSEAPRWVQRTTNVCMVVVALVAFIGSYAHMVTLGLEVGEGWRAALLPLSVDGLAIVAAMTMLVRRWSGLRAGFLAWLALVLSMGASLAANVASAEPTLEAQLWAAWPPLGLLLAMELMMQQIKARGGPGVQTVRPGAPNPFDGGDRT